MTTERKPDEQATRQAPATTGSPATGSPASTAGTISGEEGRGTGTSYTTTDGTPAEGMKQKAEDYLFECDRNARYHQARRSFFDKCHRWMMVAVLISGSAAVASVSEDIGGALLTILLMLIPVIVGAIGAGFNLSDRARDHEFLARQFFQIAAKINPSLATDERLHQWRNDIFGVYENEPDVYHALNAECYNAAAQALGKRTRQPLKKRHKCLRHLVRFSAEDFPPVILPAEDAKS